MFQCEFCQKQFSKETTVAVHMCEPKRRRLTRDDRAVQIGFQAFLRFYETMQGSARNKTFEDFCDSAYYRAFAKFGRYCLEVHVINPEQFMRWLLKNNKRVDRWASDALYTEFLIDYLTVEPVADALTRFVELSQEWHQETGNPLQDYLRYGNHNALCYRITCGGVSPWVLYNCDSGQKFLNDITPQQIEMIWPYIDSDRWQKKFNDYRADQEYVRDILCKGGY